MGQISYTINIHTDFDHEQVGWEQWADAVAEAIHVGLGFAQESLVHDAAYDRFVALAGPVIAVPADES